MSKYKIKMGKVNLTDEQVKKYKDFDKLIEQHQSNGSARVVEFTNRWKVWLTVAASIGILITGYFFTKKDTIKTGNYADEIMDERPFIDPPFQTLNIQYASFTVPGDEGGELQYATGSKIIIPSSAFVDKHGNIIHGDVDVTYREFHDPVDFFVAGVPMVYSAGGKEHHFESAGMMEINASYKGEPAFLHPDKEIQVAMASYTEEDNYNLYYLDTAAKAWMEIGKDSIIIKPDPEEELARLRANIPVAVKPAKPKRVNEDNYRFTLDFDEKDYPELAAFENTMFEVKAGQQFSTKLFDVIYDDIKLDRRKSGDYLVTFGKGLARKQFTVYPVFKEVDFAQAQATYEKQYAQYMDTRKKIELAKKTEQSLLAGMKTTDFTIRTFPIGFLGYWNCDKLRKLPFGAFMMAKFIDNKDNSIDANVYYLVDDDLNSLFRFYDLDRKQLHFNPEHENLLWTVIPQTDKIAVYKPEDFKEIDPKATESTFKMQIVKKAFDTVDELKAYLFTGLTNFSARLTTIN